MGEFRIITGSAKECQKLLNQWRHQYALNIIGMSANENLTTVLVERTRGDDKDA